MPSRRHHLEFDEVLVAKGVIAPGRRTSAVHDRLDGGAQRFGPDHWELDLNHNPEMLRNWICDLVGKLRTIQQDSLAARSIHF